MLTIAQFMDILPTLHSRKRETVALLLGLIAGGIGLGIYLRSLVDFVVPVGLAILLVTTLQADVGALGGAIISGLWGYLRVVNSNERLTKESVTVR